MNTSIEGKRIDRLCAAKEFLEKQNASLKSENERLRKTLKISHTIHPLPWKWRGDRRTKMSVITDARGKLIFGSYLCQQSDKIIINTHEAIVDTMNKCFK
jgi:hypothetical protein